MRSSGFLKLTGVKVGLTGFCMGGAVTILGAIRIPELTAAVCFYGLPRRMSPTPPTSAYRCRRISPRRRLVHARGGRRLRSGVKRAGKPPRYSLRGEAQLHERAAARRTSATGGGARVVARACLLGEASLGRKVRLNWNRLDVRAVWVICEFKAPHAAFEQAFPK